jgi:hypothetical protein
MMTLGSRLDLDEAEETAIDLAYRLWRSFRAGDAVLPGVPSADGPAAIAG